MSFKSSLKRSIRNPLNLIPSMAYRGLLNWIPDGMYLKLVYRILLGKELDLDNPQTFNEKLQWLKLHDRNPVYSDLVDKYEVKKIVGKIIGKQYIIPNLGGVYDRFEDIKFDDLPNQFVIKCTHDSGGIVVVRDKAELNIERAKKKIDKALKKNFYYMGREWPYKNVKPRIIVEKYMENRDHSDLKDYKFFAFDGVVKALFVASDRQSSEETKFDFYDMEFRHLNIINGHPNSTVPISKPETFETMRELAEKISKGIPHCRVDFYEVNGKAYFGEITFSHWSGFVPFEPEEWDRKFGEWIKLPEQYGGV